MTTQSLLIATGSGNPSGPGIASSAAIVSGVPGHSRAVVFGAPDPTSNAGDGRIWALDADTGQCIWRSPVIAPTSGPSKIGYSSPAIAHGRAYVGVSAKQPDAPITIGHMFAVNLTDGSLDAGFNFAATNGPGGGGILSSPLPRQQPELLDRADHQLLAEHGEARLHERERALANPAGAVRA